MEQTEVWTLERVHGAPPARLAVLIGELGPEEVGGMNAGAVEAVVLATQRVASWSHAMQAVAVDRCAELTVDVVEEHRVDLVAAGRTTVGVPDPEQVAAASLAPLLNISPRTMRTRVSRARQLMELPATLARARGGVLEPWRVDAVVDAAQNVTWERLGEFEARLYAVDVAGLPKPRLAERAAAAAVKAAPDGAEQARADAPRQRGLRIQPSGVPGLMRWTADVPDEESRRLHAAVEAVADQYLAADAVAGTRRSVAAARVDALVNLAMANTHVETIAEILVPTDSVASEALVTRPDPDAVIMAGVTGRQMSTPDGRPAMDPVLVDLVAGRVTRATVEVGALEWQLAQDVREHLKTAGNPFLTRVPPAGRRDAHLSAERSPSGAVPVPVAPGLETLVWFVKGLVEAPGTSGLLPSAVTALLADPDTRVRFTGVGPGTDGAADGTPEQRRTYRPGKVLAAKVRARDVRCRFPGCSVPAARCHLDHVIPHPAGETAEENLHSLCPAHHAFKHHAGWTVAMTPDGTCTWSAPTGRQHRTDPGDRRDVAA
ncbi:MAG: hypothetical protein ACRCYX_08105 [Dermatophilaceae bacterium]